ncbi:MAG: LPP20 family lipoprotein [Paracoccaceae bacterium]|nr:LPP20 family lipoprotein [Paracoccaceae bacterium]
MTCRILLFITLCCSLTGCQSNLLQNALAGNSATAAEDAAITTMSMTQSGGEEAAHVAAINEVLDASVEEIPTISAVGYAVVSSQPGRSENQRRLMAIRSARMAAMRDLAEQIHGLNVEGNTTVIDLMVQNDTFRGVVSGTIRGARTVRINPTGADTYEVVLEIDRETLSYLLKKARSVT